MKKLVIISFLFLSTHVILAQRWGIDPTLSFLQDQKDLNIKHSYDSVTVTTNLIWAGLDFGVVLESEFIQLKRQRLNKKEAGKGDDWARAWYDARKMYFEPVFEEEFDKKLRKIGITAIKDNAKAKYTIIVKATNYTFGSLSTGFSSGFANSMRNQKDSRLVTYTDYFITIVESSNESKILARTTMKYVYGRRIPMFSTYSYKAKLLSPCFQRAGKMLGKSIIKAFSK